MKVLAREGQNFYSNFRRLTLRLTAAPVLQHNDLNLGFKAAASYLGCNAPNFWGGGGEQYLLWGGWWAIPALAGGGGHVQYPYMGGHFGPK